MSRSLLFLRVEGLLLCFCGLFVGLAVGSTCCDITRASLATVEPFGTALSFLIPSIIIVVMVVLCVIGSVSLTEGEIIQLKVEKVLLNLGSTDSTVRAGSS